MPEEVQGKLAEAIQLVLMWDLPDAAIPDAVQTQAGLLAHLSADEVGAADLN